jgi:hypothetical protein
MSHKTSAPSAAGKPALARRSATSRSKGVSASKRVAQKKAASSSVSAKTLRKNRRHIAAFSSLKSRQQAVERAKMQVWRHLQEINGAIIKLAESGSYLAARTLFDFAWVYSLPPLEDEAAPAALPASPPAGESAAPQPVNRVEAFLQSLGLNPLSDEEPEPDIAA